MADDPASLNRLGIWYVNGENVAKDVSKGVVYIRRAAELGHIGAQFNMANLYNHGVDIPQEEAERCAERAAKAGDVHAQFLLGSWLQTRSPAAAANWLEQSARKGHARAQLMIGEMYLRGQGVPRDNKLAKFWLAHAIEAGDAEAQRLGYARPSQRHLQRSKEDSLKKMVLNGSGAAALTYAKLLWQYLEFDEAIAMYLLAAEGGRGEAMAMLSDLYRRGVAVNQDQALADDWLIKSVDAENFSQ